MQAIAVLRENSRIAVPGSGSMVNIADDRRAGQRGDVLVVGQLLDRDQA